MPSPKYFAIQRKNELLAEYHLGIYPGIISGLTIEQTGEQNADRLNDAMAQAKWDGSFGYEHGVAGPINRKIIFGPGNYYFKSSTTRPACLYTGHTAGLWLEGTGCGEIIGLNSGLNGVYTTFTFLDPIDDIDQYGFLARNQWTQIRGIALYGRLLNGNINSAERTITAIANTTPVQLTCNGPAAAGHGIIDGTQVTVRSTGGLGLDGTYNVTKVSDTVLELDGSSASGSTIPTGSISTVSAANPALVTTSGSHGLSDGDKVFISGTGGALVDFNYYVDVQSATTFNVYWDAELASTVGSAGGSGGTWLAKPTVVSDRMGNLIGIEGRAGVGSFSPTSRFSMRWCGGDSFTRMFRFLNGYYDEADSWNFVATGEHADNVCIEDCDFSHFNTLVRAENPNTVWNAMHRIRTGSHDADGILFDIVNSGSWYVRNLRIGSRRFTLLKISGSNGTNHKNYDIEFSRDGLSLLDQKATLFEYAGTPPSSGYQFAPRVRIQGDYNNLNADVSLLGSNPLADFGGVLDDYMEDIIFDVRGLHPDGAGGGLTDPSGCEVDSAFNGGRWWRYVNTP